MMLPCTHISFTCLYCRQDKCTSVITFLTEILNIDDNWDVMNTLYEVNWLYESAHSKAVDGKWMIQ